MTNTKLEQQIRGFLTEFGAHTAEEITDHVFPLWFNQKKFYARVLNVLRTRKDVFQKSRVDPHWNVACIWDVKPSRPWMASRGAEALIVGGEE